MLYSYRRVSTDDQQLGPQAQADAIKRWGVCDTDFLDAGVSGSIPLCERPVGSKMIAMLQPGDTVIVSKLDRLFRSTADAAVTLDDWCKRDIKLVSLHEGFDMTTSMGKFMSSVMAAFAELERAMIRERTSAALQAKMARGEHHGAIPFGWNRANGKLVEHMVEQVVIRKARELKAAGLINYRVANYLNEHGYISKRGGQWTEKKVRMALAFDNRMRRIGVNNNPEVLHAATVNNPDRREPDQSEG